MKNQSSPKIEYFEDATIRCTCGNVLHVGSTQKAMQTEICSACHPYYTGKSKVVDTAGRVERFKARLEKFSKFKEQHKNLSRKPTKKS